jgi:hypothetical protein
MKNSFLTNSIHDAKSEVENGLVPNGQLCQSTLKMWDKNIPNVILVKCKFSAPSTPCPWPFPLTPLEIIKRGES